MYSLYASNFDLMLQNTLLVLSGHNQLAKLIGSSNERGGRRRRDKAQAIHHNQVSISTKSRYTPLGLLFRIT